MGCGHDSLPSFYVTEHPCAPKLSMILVDDSINLVRKGSEYSAISFVANSMKDRFSRSVKTIAHPGEARPETSLVNGLWNACSDGPEHKLPRVGELIRDLHRSSQCRLQTHRHLDLATLIEINIAGFVAADVP